MAYTVAGSRRKQTPRSAIKDHLVTFDQFYEMVDEKTKADLLDGKIVRDSPAVPKHALVATWVSTFLNIYAEKLDLGEVLGATATVRLTPYNAPEPDVFFIRKGRLNIINDRFVDGPPDLCVEVISRSSRKYDHGRKFVLYAEQRVQEYWIIDPLQNTAEFYVNRGSEFVAIEPDAQGRLHSQVLEGLWVKLEWFTAPSLPPVLEVLQMVLEAKAPLI